MNLTDKKPILNIVANTISLNSNCCSISFPNGYTIEISNLPTSRHDPYVTSKDIEDVVSSIPEVGRSYSVELVIFDNTGRNVTFKFDKEKRRSIPFVNPYELGIWVYVVCTLPAQRTSKHNIKPLKTKTK